MCNYRFTSLLIAVISVGSFRFSLKEKRPLLYVNKCPNTHYYVSTSRIKFILKPSCASAMTSGTRGDVTRGVCQRRCSGSERSFPSLHFFRAPARELEPEREIIKLKQNLNKSTTKRNTAPHCAEAILDLLSSSAACFFCCTS